MPRKPRSKAAKAKAGTTQVTSFVDDSIEKIEDMECACEDMAHRFYLIYHDEDGKSHTLP